MRRSDRTPRILHATVTAAIAVTLLLGLPTLASANPGKVADILRQSGNSGVVRGPKTISNKQKNKLAGVARQAASRTGGKVYVVIVNSDTKTKPYAKLYKKLNMGKGDVLIVSNGPKWELRCDGISKSDKSKLLKAVMSNNGDPLSRATSLLKGIPKALGHSQAKAKAGKSSSPPIGGGSGSTDLATKESAGGFPWVAIFFLLFVAGGVGFVIFRRKQRDASLDADFKAALDPAENHMADFYLGTDGFESHPQFSNMLAKGTQISTQIDALKAKTPTREAISKAKTLAKEAAAIESELRGLK